MTSGEHGANPIDPAEAAIRARFGGVDTLDASADRALADLDARFGTGPASSTPAPAHLRTFPPRPDAPAVEHRPRFGTLTGTLREAAAGLGRRLPEADLGRMAESFIQRASRVATFGQPLWELIRHPINTGKAIGKGALESKTELGFGAISGTVSKEAAKWAVTLLGTEASTLLGRAMVGAAAGAATGAVKEYWIGLRGYEKFKKDLDGKLQQSINPGDQRTVQNEQRIKAMGEEYKHLQDQLAAETDSRKKEAIGDQMRYLRFLVRKSVNGRSALDQFMADTSLTQADIEKSIRVIKSRVARRAAKGAVWGAMAGMGGGILADHLLAPLGGKAKELLTNVSMPEIPEIKLGMPEVPMPDIGALVGETAQNVGNLAGGALQTAGQIKDQFLPPPAATPEATQAVSATPAPTPAPAAEFIDPNLPHDQAVQELAQKVYQSDAYQEHLRKRVDDNLDLALAKAGVNQLSPEVYDQAREAVKQRMEDLANQTYGPGVQQYIQVTGGVNLNDMTNVMDQDFANRLNTRDWGESVQDTLKDYLRPSAAPAPAAPAAPEAAPSTPPSPATAEPLPPTKAPTGATIQGSTMDNSLTYDGKPWVIVDNGVKNIGHLFKAVGEAGDIDQQALAGNLQKATDMWAHGQLSDNPDLYRIFHLSNGTASVYNDLLNDDTLESLKKLGVIKK